MTAGFEVRAKVASMERAKQRRENLPLTDVESHLGSVERITGTRR